MTLQHQAEKNCCINCRHFWIDDCNYCQTADGICEHCDDDRPSRPLPERYGGLKRAIENLGFVATEPPISRQLFTRDDGNEVRLINNGNSVLCNEDVRVVREINWSHAPQGDNQSEWDTFYRNPKHVNSVFVSVKGTYSTEMQNAIDIAIQIEAEYNRLLQDM